MNPDANGVITLDEDVNGVVSVELKFTSSIEDKQVTVKELIVEACIKPEGMTIIQQWI